MSADPTPPAPRLAAVSAYLLGTTEFEAAWVLQRRLAFDVSGAMETGAVIVCDHPPGLTIGREGSRAHVRLTPEELAARQWGVQWVARGGGCVLHVPGQVCVYPILPLTTLGLTPGGYVAALTAVAADLVAGFGVQPEIDAAVPGVCVRRRRVAHVGVAVGSGVTSFGVVLNVSPDLELFRDVDADGDPTPVTSLQRECPVRVRIQAVRQRMLELLAARFGFGRLSVFHNYPTFPTRVPRHAITARHR